MAKASKPSTPTLAPEAPSGNPNIHYECWQCSIVFEGEGKDRIRKVQKLRIMRQAVHITEEAAKTLNTSAFSSPRLDYVVMYFRPGQTEPELN